MAWRPRADCACRVEEALKFGALSANISSQEPIDVVMHESCAEHATLWDNYKQIKFVPFNPTDKYTIASVVPNDGSPPYRLMKGAPQVLLGVHPVNSATVSSVVAPLKVLALSGGPEALGE